MQNIKAVILAAGKGTRMKSDLPKVVHKIHGKCLVDYVIEAARGAGAQEICLVVGYKQDIVCSSVAHKDVSYVLQPEQLGTNHTCSKMRAGVFRRGRHDYDIIWGYAADYL